MKTEQTIYTESKGWSKKSDNKLGQLAQLVLVFGKRELLVLQQHFDYIQKLYPNAEVVGCSTSGDICGEEIYNNSIVCTAVQFDKTTLRIVSEEVTKMDDSFRIGQQLIANLPKDNLAHILVLSEGLNINGSELTKGLNSQDGENISVTGGLAGDLSEFKQTLIINNAAGKSNLVVAIGFYGSHLQVGYGSMGGWDSFGVDRLVTRSSSNILYELDGQPALALYKKYLGSHAENLPSSALLFPLSYFPEGSEVPVVRTILSVDETNGSMTFAGDIPEGSYVRLMKASFEKLVDGAYNAATKAKNRLGNSDPELAILISCVGRRLVMKQRVEQELENVREVLGNETTITGFYSYGEISPMINTSKQCELHNQTMTVTVFKEK